MSRRGLKHDLGIPDWRDRASYPEEEAPDEVWRWEFLRRRDDYRNAWREQYDVSQAYFDNCDARGELEGFGNSRTNYYAIGLSPARDRFGLEFMLAPSMPYRPRLFKLSYGFSIRDVTAQSVWDRMDEREQLAIVFDLHLPIADQLEKAKKHLLAFQVSKDREGRSRYHRRQWPTYLRTLDAREAGETFEKIYQHLLLSDLPAAEYDAKAESGSSWRPLGRQLWQQARDVMFKLTS